MKKHFLIVIIAICLSGQVFSQSIGIGTNTPASSSVLELKSTNQGILIPRMTQSQRLNIPGPAQGLLVYQTDIDTGFHYYSGNGWKALAKTNGPANNTQLNKIIYTKGVGVDSKYEIWTANYDGSNQTKINITLPAGFEIGGDARLSPDGLTIIFTASDTSYKDSIFVCNANGSNAHMVVDGSTASSKGLILGGAD